MSTVRDTRNAGKQQKQQEEAKGKKGTPSSPSEASGKAGEMNVEHILRELRELRRENKDSFADTKSSLSRLEVSVAELNQRMEKLEQRTEEVETRVGVAEDTGQRHDRMLRHLLKREAALTNMCDDLQNRMRRNNLRIYQVPEGSENSDTVGFVKKLMETALQLPPEINIQIERAHRSLELKPARSAPPRSIIVRFLDYSVKEAVLRQAWAQRQVKFQGEVIYFDQDYSPEVQRRRARVRGVIKQLKEKGIQAKCRFPAQLRVHLESGVKTFPTLLEAAPTLKEMGIAVQVNERERLEWELSKEAWQRQGDGRRARNDASLSVEDLQSVFQF